MGSGASLLDEDARNIGQTRKSLIIPPAFHWVWIQTIASFPSQCSICVLNLHSEGDAIDHCHQHHYGSFDSILVWKMAYVEVIDNNYIQFKEIQETEEEDQKDPKKFLGFETESITNINLNLQNEIPTLRIEGCVHKSNTSNDIVRIDFVNHPLHCDINHSWEMTIATASVDSLQSLLVVGLGSALRIQSGCEVFFQFIHTITPYEFGTWLCNSLDPSWQSFVKASWFDTNDTELLIATRLGYQSTLNLFKKWGSDAILTDTNGNNYNGTTGSAVVHECGISNKKKSLQRRQGVINDIASVFRSDDKCISKTRRNIDVDLEQDALSRYRTLRYYINAPGNGGVSALHQCAYLNDSQTLELLVGLGGNPFLVDAGGSTPAHYAILRQSLECIVVLLEYAYESFYIQNYMGNTALHEAVRIHPNYAVIQLLLEAGIDPTMTNMDHQTPYDIIKYKNRSCKGENILDGNYKLIRRVQRMLKNYMKSYKSIPIPFDNCGLNLYYCHSVPMSEIELVDRTSSSKKYSANEEKIGEIWATFFENLLKSQTAVSVISASADSSYYYDDKSFENYNYNNITNFHNDSFNRSEELSNYDSYDSEWIILFDYDTECWFYYNSITEETAWMEEEDEGYYYYDDDANDKSACPTLKDEMNEYHYYHNYKATNNNKYEFDEDLNDEDSSYYYYDTYRTSGTSTNISSNRISSSNYNDVNDNSIYDWEEFYDVDSDSVYYYNHRLYLSQWEVPECWNYYYFYGDDESYSLEYYR